MARLSIEEVKYLSHVLAQERYNFDEPIPDFSTRYPNILESCIAVPFQTYDRRELYSAFIDKSAILFYLMIKNHPFQNGNKRVAVTTLLVFLAKHDKWIDVDIRTLYNFAVSVAGSKPSQKNKILKHVASFLKTFMVPY
ncbi:MAG: type II toxin-antitoxin system death-on-curing family toxin [Candidatus Omnitrophota bacterium]